MLLVQYILSLSPSQHVWPRPLTSTSTALLDAAGNRCAEAADGIGVQELLVALLALCSAQSPKLSSECSVRVARPGAPFVASCGLIMACLGVENHRLHMGISTDWTWHGQRTKPSVSYSSRLVPTRPDSSLGFGLFFGTHSPPSPLMPN